MDRIELVPECLPVRFGSGAAVFLNGFHAGIRRINDQEAFAGVIGKVEIFFGPIDLFTAGPGDDFAGFDLPDGTSVVGGIFAQGFDFIAEIFEPDGQFHSGRIDVENSAAPREFADSDRLRFVIVAESHKMFDQFRHRKAPAAMEDDSRSLEFLRVRGRREKRQNGTDDDIRRIVSRHPLQQFRPRGFAVQSDGVPPGAFGKQRRCYGDFRCRRPDFQLMRHLFRDPVGGCREQRFPAVRTAQTQPQRFQRGGIFINGHTAIFFLLLR